MSEAENPTRIDPAHRVGVADIRVLAGAATPHFALQVRNRIRRLIEPLADDDPARQEGERQIARLEELSKYTGEPRGIGPVETEE